MLAPKYRVQLKESEKTELQQLIRRHSTAQNIVKWAQIILLANGEGQTNKKMARPVGMNKCDVTRWTKRWRDRATEPVKERLSDAPRSGARIALPPSKGAESSL